MADEDIDIYLRWKQENVDVASDASNRIDRITDALMRQRIAAEAMQARLSALQDLGLFNLGSGAEGAASRLQATLNSLENQTNYLKEIDRYMSGQVDMDKYMSGEVENQNTWWQRIKLTLENLGIGALRTSLEAIGDMFSSGPMSRIPLLGSGFQSIGGALEGMSASGATAIPVLGTIGAILIVIIASLVALVAWLGILTASIAAAVIIVGTFLVAGAGLLAFLGLAGLGIAALVGGLIYWGVVAQGGATAAATLATATKQLQGAQEGLDASQLAISKWWATHPYGPQNQNDVLTLQGLTDRLRDSQEKLALAQTNYSAAVNNSQSPLQQLMGTLSGIGDQLEPLAIGISNTAVLWANAWLQQISPAVVSTATTVIDWVGTRMMGVLNGVKQIVTDLAPSFSGLGQFLAAMFDRIGPNATANKFSISGFVEGGANLGIRALEGLLNNLERLSNWFEQRLPTYGPIVQQIFGKAGDIIQGTITDLGRFSDWLVGNWPAITKQLGDAIQGIQDAWTKIGPGFTFFVSNIWPQMASALQDLSTKSGGWLTMLVALAIVILGLTYLALSVAAQVNDLADALSRFVGWVGTLLSILPGAGGPSGAGGGVLYRGPSLSDRASTSSTTTNNSTNNSATVIVHGAQVSDPAAIAKTVRKAIRAANNT